MAIRIEELGQQTHIGGENRIQRNFKLKLTTSLQR